MRQILEGGLFSIYPAPVPLPSFITEARKLKSSVSWLMSAAQVARRYCLCQWYVGGSLGEGFIFFYLKGKALGGERFCSFSSSVYVLDTGGKY